MDLASLTNNSFASNADLPADGNGNIGIGTVSPSTKLDVQGNFNVGFWNQNYVSTLTSDSTPNSPTLSVFKNISDASSEIIAKFQSYKNGTGIADKFWVKSDGTGYFAGNVGIGTATPAYTLDVNGTIRSNNVSPSDIRLKENIEPVQSAMEKVNTLQGVLFNWKKSDSYRNFPEGRHYGVIAQQIEKVLPEIVSTGPDGIKSVAYTEIIPVLIEAIKEQQREIEQLKLQLDLHQR